MPKTREELLDSIKRKRLIASIKEKREALPQVLGNEAMTPEHTQQVENQGLDAVTNVAKSLEPRIPLVTEGAEALAAGARSLVGDQSYSDIRDEQHRERAIAEGQQPVLAATSNIIGGGMSPGGMLAGMGQLTADELLQRDGDVQKTIDEAGMDLGKTALAGLGLKGAGKLLPKVLGKSGSKAKQDKKIDEFINPTASQRANPEYRANTEYLADEVLLPMKANKAKVNREEVMEAAASKRDAVGEELGDLRKAETGMTRKDLSKHLKQKGKETDANMDSKARAEFKKAASATLPQEYHQLNKQLNTITGTITKDKGRLKKISEKLANAKASAINLAPKITVKGKSVNNPKFVRAKIKVEQLEKQVLEAQTGIETSVVKLDGLKNKMSDIEDGAVTLDHLYTQKKNLKGPDHSGEGERALKALEDTKGGQIFQDTKADFGRAKEMAKITEAEFGKHAIGKNAPNPHVPIGRLNRAIKAVQTVLPKHKEALKLSGIESTSKLLKNDKWRKGLTDAMDRNGAKGMATAHMMLMRRDSKYREQYNEEQKKKLEEAE